MTRKYHHLSLSLFESKSLDLTFRFFPDASRSAAAHAAGATSQCTPFATIANGQDANAALPTTAAGSYSSCPILVLGKDSQI